jgi:hypothetical protein
VIEFIARVKCDRPGCTEQAEYPVIQYESGLEADYPVGAWHEMPDRVECNACFNDLDRFREEAP